MTETITQAELPPTPVRCCRGKTVAVWFVALAGVLSGGARRPANGRGRPPGAARRRRPPGAAAAGAGGWGSGGGGAWWGGGGGGGRFLFRRPPWGGGRRAFCTATVTSRKVNRLNSTLME